MKPSLGRRIITAFALLAMVTACGFGAGRSFVCKCAGVEVRTTADHCDGPEHGAHCLAAHAEDRCLPDTPHGPDREEHSVTVQELTVSTPAKVLSAPMHGGAIVAMLPLALHLEAAPAQFFGAAFFGRALDSPPPALRLSHTVSLLI